MEFKIGDRVENKRFGKGTVREISDMFQPKVLVQFDKANLELHNGKNSEKLYKDYTCFWFFNNCSNLKLIREKIKKSDLKNGDIVTYRNGVKRFVSGDKLVENGYFCSYLKGYEDDLTKADSKELDIIKVERPYKYETIFERKEEILDETEKRYLKAVIRPFRNKISSIMKETNPCTLEQFIHISLNGESISLPYFKAETMYKGMKPFKRYTLEELEL